MHSSGIYEKQAHIRRRGNTTLHTVQYIRRRGNTTLHTVQYIRRRGNTTLHTVQYIKKRSHIRRRGNTTLHAVQYIRRSSHIRRSGDCESLLHRLRQGCSTALTAAEHHLLQNLPRCELSQQLCTQNTPSLNHPRH